MTTAIGEAAALEAATPDVDASLLDRRMAELSGDETVARLHELGLDA